jgi:hypothetical protein
VPETGSARILQKAFPPLSVRVRARPRQQRVHITPVLPHTDVHRENGIDDCFVPQKPVRPSLRGGGNLRTKADERLNSSDAIHPHPQINHHQVRKSGKIYGSSIDMCTHNLKDASGRQSLQLRSSVSITRRFPGSIAPPARPSSKSDVWSIILLAFTGSNPPRYLAFKR